MLGKLWFRWMGPYWIVNYNKGTYQLRTLAGEVMPKWVNGFRLKPYEGPTLTNPFLLEESNDQANPTIDNTMGSRSTRPITVDRP